MLSIYIVDLTNCRSDVMFMTESGVRLNLNEHKKLDKSQVGGSRESFIVYWEIVLQYFLTKLALWD